MAMPTRVTIEYDCGHIASVPCVLRPDQTLLHNSTLGDQLLVMADQQHDQECTKCTPDIEEG